MTTLIFSRLTYSVGEFALSYLVNGDPSGLSDEDQCLIDEWFSHATDDFFDADDNRWTYSHLAVKDDSRNEFAFDDVTSLYGSIYMVELFFVPINNKQTN